MARNGLVTSSALFLFVSRIYKEYVNALNIKTK